MTNSLRLYQPSPALSATLQHLLAGRGQVPGRDVDMAVVVMIMCNALPQEGHLIPVIMKT